MISGTESVAMSNQKFPAIKLELLGFKINRNIQFSLQVVFHPHIVVAHEKMNRCSSIGYFCKFAEQPCITLRNYSSVFVPEIEHVAYNKNSRSIVSYLLKKFNN